MASDLRIGAHVVVKTNTPRLQKMGSDGHRSGHVRQSVWSRLIGRARRSGLVRPTTGRCAAGRVAEHRKAARPVGTIGGLGGSSHAVIWGDYSKSPPVASEDYLPPRVLEFGAF
jgi:hypothetical protein